MCGRDCMAWALFACGLLLMQSAAAETNTGELPSTGAVTAAVAGGLLALAGVLAAALILATGSIHGWRCLKCFGRARSAESLLPTTHKQQESRDSLLEQRTSGTAGHAPLPVIVASRLAVHASDSDEGAVVGAALGNVANSSGGGGRGSSGVGPSPVLSSATVDSQRSGSSADGVRSTSGSILVPLASDTAWKDCLIDSSQLQILRKRDGSPWQLGAGAFGQVYKALYDGVQVVAAKVLTGLRDEAALDAFVREARILRDCRDRNIVQLVGICADMDELDEAIMVVEFMEGGDLHRALRWRDQTGRRVFGWYGRGRKVALDIARGLHYLHSRKIVHFDLKSANILLTRDGSCKIADVGLAKTLMSRGFTTQAGTLGTFAWSAPEVLTGRQCNERADIYSYGIVLWEICTGETPMRGDMRSPDVPTECPAEVLELIKQCTHVRASNRPSARQVIARLEQILNIQHSAAAGVAGTGLDDSAGTGSGGSAGGSGVAGKSSTSVFATLAPWRRGLKQNKDSSTGEGIQLASPVCTTPGSASAGTPKQGQLAVDGGSSGVSSGVSSSGQLQVQAPAPAKPTQQMMFADEEPSFHNGMVAEHALVKQMQQAVVEVQPQQLHVPWRDLGTTEEPEKAAAAEQRQPLSQQQQQQQEHGAAAPAPAAAAAPAPVAAPAAPVVPQIPLRSASIPVTLQRPVAASPFASPFAPQAAAAAPQQQQRPMYASPFASPFAPAAQKDAGDVPAAVAPPRPAFASPFAQAAQQEAAAAAAPSPPLASPQRPAFVSPFAQAAQQDAAAAAPPSPPLPSPQRPVFMSPFAQAAQEVPGVPAAAYLQQQRPTYASPFAQAAQAAPAAAPPAAALQQQPTPASPFAPAAQQAVPAAVGVQRPNFASPFAPAAAEPSLAALLGQPRQLSPDGKAEQA